MFTSNEGWESNYKVRTQYVQQAADGETVVELSEGQVRRRLALRPLQTPTLDVCAWAPTLSCVMVSILFFKILSNGSQSDEKG